MFKSKHWILSNGCTLCIATTSLFQGPLLLMYAMCFDLRLSGFPLTFQKMLVGEMATLDFSHM